MGIGKGGFPIHKGVLGRCSEGIKASLGLELVKELDEIIEKVTNLLFF